LKQHTGEIISRVQRGKQIIITLRGRPVAVLSSIDQAPLEEALAAEAKRARGEVLSWFSASESTFGFWDNEEDAIWDEAEVR
jgi:prevent-host-death family protein